MFNAIRTSYPQRISSDTNLLPRSVHTILTDTNLPELLVVKNLNFVVHNFIICLLSCT